MQYRWLIYQKAVFELGTVFLHVLFPGNESGKEIHLTNQLVFYLCRGNLMEFIR